MKVRKFSVETDYRTVCSWWDAHKHAHLSPTILPETGVTVLDAKGEMIACSWIYFTNSRMALIDWTIVRPDAPLMQRGKAVNAAFQQLELLARAAGIDTLFGFSSYRGLTKTMVRLGYTRSGHPGDVMYKNFAGE